MAQGRSTKIISMIKWIRTSRLTIKTSLSLCRYVRLAPEEVDETTLCELGLRFYKNTLSYLGSRVSLSISPKLPEGLRPTFLSLTGFSCQRVSPATQAAQRATTGIFVGF